jgi:radical SAM protein with 4Fe4S-binding SPASM domain
MGDCACDVSVAQLDPAAPLSTVYLELTPACNNACPGCSNVFAHHDAPPTLSAAEWGCIFERLSPAHTRLRFTGGEPTVHPEFEQIVSQAQAMGFAFSIFTNARWRKPAHMARFLTGLDGLECILVSLHGAHARSHEAFTATRGSFTETIANIRRAGDAGVRVNTSTVIVRQNYAEIREIIALSQALGAGRAVFNRYIGVALPGREASTAQLKMAVATVEHASHNGSMGRVKFGTPIPHCFTSNSSNGCVAGFAHVTVDPWGNVRPCPHVPLVAGNLLTEPLAAILQAPIMQEWRRGYLAQCEGCNQRGACLAGCHALRLLRRCACDPLMR